MSKNIRRRPELPLAAPASGDGEVGNQTHMGITPERVRLRAYEIYAARNGAPGDADSDWVQAERELNGWATPGSSNEDAIAASAVLQAKTRGETQRPPRRGGL